MKKLFSSSNVSLATAVVFLSSIFGLAATASFVSAQEHEDSRMSAAQHRKEEAKKRIAELRANHKERLDAAKLRACQNRERAINAIMSRIATRGERHLQVFNKISERVQNFYQTSGLSVENYDALLAEVNAKKAVAELALEEIKASQAEFKCDGTDPKGAARIFKDSLKKQIDALKAYRTAIKNIIVAVKTVAGASDEESGPS